MKRYAAGFAPTLPVTARRTPTIAVDLGREMVGPAAYRSDRPHEGTHGGGDKDVR
jgi:hypothetical protein